MLACFFFCLCLGFSPVCGYFPASLKYLYSQKILSITYGKIPCDLAVSVLECKASDGYGYGVEGVLPPPVAETLVLFIPRKIVFYMYNERINRLLLALLGMQVRFALEEYALSLL